MGCVGHPLVKTPNLDALAERGTLFEAAYTPSPMCVPTRAAMACGDHVHRTGFWDSATAYDGSQRSWMHQLRDAGVPVTSIGKLHFQSAKNDNGFTEELLPMHVVGEVGWAVGLLRENPPAYDSAAELAQDVGAGNTTYTDYDLAITETTKQWLQANKDASEPWAAFVSLVSPHYPLKAPQEFYDMYPLADMDLPIAYEPTARPHHSELKNIASFFKYDQYFNEHKIRQAKAAYYGLISFMDSCVGSILDTLTATGQAENTVVLYVSDHGDMMGDHGLWTKQVMYEPSVGVPMIAAGPGIPQGKRIKTGTTLLDIAATAFDISGVTEDIESRKLPGLSLKALANADNDLNRTIFSEYHDGGSTTGTFMVRWQNWKYVYYVGHPPQLFDMVSDPNELCNLAEQENSDTTIAAILLEGEHRLRAICDPESVNERCFSNQAQRIKELGGRDACENAYVFNHTPTPSEQEKLEN